jgi:hypothetical protein
VCRVAGRESRCSSSSLTRTAHCSYHEYVEYAASSKVRLRPPMRGAAERWGCALTRGDANRTAQALVLDVDEFAKLLHVRSAAAAALPSR